MRIVFRFVTTLSVSCILSIRVFAANQVAESNALPPKSLGAGQNTSLFASAPERLFSPSVSQLFYNMAYEIIHDENSTPLQEEQAFLFLNAATEIDASAGSVTADMLTLMSKPGPARHLRALYDLIIEYCNKDADFEVATSAIRHLLEQLNTRQQRQALLSRLIRDIGESNPTINSELVTTLGLLNAEKADDPNAARLLAIAYNWNRYNQLAFEKLLEIVPEQINLPLYLEYLRLKLRKNPLDIDTAIIFAQQAERIQLYDISTGSFEYCADLFRFLYPGRDIPSALYLDWMKSCYNTSRSQPKCLQLAEQFRGQGLFDLRMEVFASKIAAKTGEPETAEQILATAEQMALQMANQNDSDAGYDDLAWFYSFVRPDSNLAIEWANKAYSIEPNSPVAAGLLAYAFAVNKEPNLAKPLLDQFPQTQLTTLARAQIQLDAGMKQPAIELLRAAIDIDPASIEAEHAKLILTEQKTDYIPIYDAAAIISILKQTTGEQIVPQFVSPDKMMSFQLNIHGNRFSYGNDIDGLVSITNTWYEPIVISGDSLCRGHISVDVNVTGDLQVKIPKLVIKTTRPTQPIDPGHSVIIPVRLCTGPLKQLLLSHPQATLKMEFTAWLDPVETKEGDTISAIPGMKPSIVQIERPKVEITSEYLQNRLNSLTKGKQGPKIKAAQLFAGLVMESVLIKSTDYKTSGATWMSPVLKSALVQSLNDTDWVVKIHSMAAVADLPLDYELTSAAAEGLNNPNWPTRMMAVWLLATKQGYNFSKVLDHTAQYDQSPYVRNMAAAFGATTGPAQPLEQPLLDLLRTEPNTPW